MSVDSNIKFTRARKGYDPQEVDTAFDEMQKQIENLEQQQDILSDTLAQYDKKIRQFEAGTKNLEDARTKESLRIMGVLDKAVWAAGETEQEAHQKAAQIIKTAQLEAQNINNKALKGGEAAQAALSGIRRNLQMVREINRQFYAYAESTLGELDVLLKEALDKFAPVSAPVPDSPYAPPAPFPVISPPPAVALEPSAEPTPDLPRMTWQI